MYFSHGEFIELYTSRLVDCDEIKEIISRLEVVTSGCKVIDLCCLYFITEVMDGFMVYMKFWATEESIRFFGGEVKVLKISR